MQPVTGSLANLDLKCKLNLCNFKRKFASIHSYTLLVLMTEAYVQLMKVVDSFHVYSDETVLAQLRVSHDMSCVPSIRRPTENPGISSVILCRKSPC